MKKLIEIPRRFKALKGAWFYDLVVFMVVSASSVWVAKLSIDAAIPWRACVEAAAIVCLLLAFSMYREARSMLPNYARRVVIIELQMLVFAIGTLAGRVYYEHGLGTAILEGIGVIVLVELIVWAILDLADEEDFYGLPKWFAVSGLVLGSYRIHGSSRIALQP